MENIWIACDISYRFLDGDEDPMRYWTVRERLKKMSKPEKSDREIASRVNALKLAVDNVIDSDTVADRNLHRKMLIESDVSWILILLCAASALLGIGLKWAKAIFEFRMAVTR